MKLALTCGCCGIGFDGEHDPSHDFGFGTCESCAEYEEQEANSMLDKLAADIESKLSPENAKSFSQKTQEAKRSFAMSCINKGLVSWSFG